MLETRVNNKIACREFLDDMLNVYSIYGCPM